MAAGGKTHREIADAVVARLNAASLSLALTAARSYDPPIELATDLAAVRVDVLTTTDIVEPLDRDDNAHLFEIAIAVRKKIDGQHTNAVLDPLGDLCEEIANELDNGDNRQLTLATQGRATWTAAESRLLTDHLSDFGQFSWLYLPTYRHQP